MTESTNPSDQPITDNEPEMNDAELLATEKVVAEAVLKSEHAWDVVRELYAQCCMCIANTQQFVIPVLNNRVEITKRLSDPEGFSRQFTTLMADIKYIADTIKTIYAKHEHLSGEPTEEQAELLFEVSTAYSEALEHFERCISPLIFAMVETLKAEYSEMLDLTPKDDQEATDE